MNQLLKREPFEEGEPVFVSRLASGQPLLGVVVCYDALWVQVYVAEQDRTIEVERGRVCPVGKVGYA